MMMSDPKKIAMLILATSKDGVTSVEEKEGPIDENKFAQVAAAERLIKAFETKDASEVVEAFKTLFTLCETHEDEDLFSDDEDELGFGGY